MVEHFFIGVDKPWMLKRVPKPLVSVNSAMGRRLDLRSKELAWVDSGAFQIVRKLGHFPFGDGLYASWVEAMGPTFFTQLDWPCEPAVLAKTGYDVHEHQRRSLQSAHCLARSDVGKATLVPTIQGWTPEQYLEMAGHLEDLGLWRPYMAVGSVCRRNQSAAVVAVLTALREFSPNTRYHGFGVKSSPEILELLWSCDSFAWRYKAWREHAAKFPGSKDDNSTAWVGPFLDDAVQRGVRLERRGVRSGIQTTLRSAGAATVV